MSGVVFPSNLIANWSLAMRLSPRFVEAAAFVFIAGVVSGAVLGIVPPIRQVAVEDQLPERSAAPMVWRHDSGPPPPDQYPIETPEGRFEVEELSIRGLYRNARFAQYNVYPAYDAYGESYAASEPATAKIRDGYVEVPDARPAVERAADTAPEADEIPVTAVDAVSGPPEDPETADNENAAVTVASAGPRIVDVAAELAE